MAGKPAAGSIRSMLNDPKPRLEPKADRAMAAANDPRVTSGKASTAQRARENDPKPGGSGRGSNLGKYLHPAKGKR